MAASAFIRERLTSMYRNLLQNKTPYLVLTTCRNQVPCFSKWREASICSATLTRAKKRVYPRTYKVRLVQPDGSSLFIRYKDPLRIITMPIDPATMTEEERKARIKRLRPEKPKKIYELEDEQDDSYDQRSWSKLLKKR